MRSALATLPWVERRSIETDRATRTARFGVNDRRRFSLEKIKAVLGPRYNKGLVLVEGP